MRLDESHSSEDKARWKIVRTDNYTDVPGDIVSADEVTGEASVSVRKIDDHGLFAVDTAGNPVYETKALSFGTAGLRIVGRRR